MKDWTSVMFLGIGHSLTPAILTGSISTWPSDRIRPRYLTVGHSKEHFRFQVELVLPEDVEDMRYHLPVMLNCLCEDQDVVHVNGYKPFIYKVLENVIHHGLECGWAVSEPEVHDQGLEEPAVCLESCLPLVTFLDSYVIVSPPYFQLGKVFGFCTCDLIYDIRDEGEWVGVFHCHRVELPVVWMNL